MGWKLNKNLTCNNDRFGWKTEPLPFTGLARLNGLRINLVTVETLFEEQFVLILKENFFEYMERVCSRHFVARLISPV